MNNWFLYIYDYLHGRRRFCMALLALLSGVLLWLVFSLHYNENIFDFLPMSDKQQKAMSVYQDISGGQSLVTMFKVPDSEGADDLTTAMDAYCECVLKDSAELHITEVTSRADLDFYLNLTDFLYNNIPVMLVGKDYLRMDSCLSQPHFFEEQLDHDLQVISSPMGAVEGSFIARDPLGLFSPVLDRLQARQAALPFLIQDGLIYTQGAEYALVLMTSPYGTLESANNTRLVSRLESIAVQIHEEYPTIEIGITGAPVISVGNARQIKNDSVWTISIAMVLILLLLYLSMRSIKSLLLIGLSIVFGWVFAMGFMSLLHQDVSLIVLGIGSVIIGIAVNYPLHFVSHATPGGNMHTRLKEMVAPLLIGNITTVGAFASLVPLDAPALRDLGLFAAFMLMGTILFVLIFLPHLMKPQDDSGEHILFGRIASLSPRLSSWGVALFTSLTLFLGVNSCHVAFDSDILHINYMEEEQERLLTDLGVAAGLTDTTSLYIVSEADTWDAALSGLESKYPQLEQWCDEYPSQRYSNLTAFICSEQEQQRRIDRWKAFWGSRRESIAQSLNEQAAKTGFAEGAFADFYQLADADYTPKAFEYFQPIVSLLYANSFSASTGRKSVVEVIDTQGTDMKPLKSSLEEIITSDDSQSAYRYLFDLPELNRSITLSLSDNFNYIGFACGLIVFIFLWFSFGRIELSILAFLPMALGWIWILGTMHLLGIQFNIVNVILATFIFGQGDDYTIFITEGLMYEYTYGKKLLASFKNSIIISALIMFIGMGSLIVARHPALYSLAEVTIVGMLCVLLMAWIVPGFLYGWLVGKDKSCRMIPVTLSQLCRTFIYRVFRRLPGMQMTRIDAGDEKFTRPAIIRYTAHSALDAHVLRNLSPNILVAEPGMKEDALTEALQQGRVVASSDEKLVQELVRRTKYDILPVYIGGTEMILPFGCHVLAEGQVWIKVAARNAEYRMELFEQSVRKAHYYHHLLIGQYLYKGFRVEQETRKQLLHFDDYAAVIDHYQPSHSSQRVNILNCGRGQFALLFAWTHPEQEVYAYCSDPDDVAFVNSCSQKPSNLSVGLQEQSRDYSVEADVLDVVQIQTSLR